jgi:sulfide:quinone oxidoreductase
MSAARAAPDPSFLGGEATMSQSDRPVLCIVGAGTAGLEALLAARERLGTRVKLCLIAPDREFHYRPIHPGQTFRPVPERFLRIADVIAELGADWVLDRVAAVHAADRQLLTRDGELVDFDYLLLAAGVSSHRTLHHGEVWQRGTDPRFLDRIIDDAVAGTIDSVAIVIPRGARWPVPAYELALVLAWRAAGSRTKISLITSEEHPLAALGTKASDLVLHELRDAGIHLQTGVEVVDQPRDWSPKTSSGLVLLVPERPDQLPDALTGRPADPARIRIGAGHEVEFDRLISLPAATGPAIAGVPTDACGFIAVDEAVKVRESGRIWAVGGGIAAALEHSAVAATQADAAITEISAAISGADAAAAPSRLPELTGILLSGQREHWLAQNPPGTGEISTRCLWWPPGRAVGRLLAQRISAGDPSTLSSLPDAPPGLPIRVPVVLAGADSPWNFEGPVSAASRAAQRRDMENRQLMAIHRREQEANAELRSLSARLQSFKADEAATIRELRTHGYLQDRGAPPAA